MELFAVFFQPSPADSLSWKGNKDKIKHLDGVFEMFEFLEILKTCGFVFAKINLVL